MKGAPAGRRVISHEVLSMQGWVVASVNGQDAKNIKHLSLSQESPSSLG